MFLPATSTLAAVLLTASSWTFQLENAPPPVPDKPLFHVEGIPLDEKGNPLPDGHVWFSSPYNWGRAINECQEQMPKKAICLYRGYG